MKVNKHCAEEKSRGVYVWELELVLYICENIKNKFSFYPSHFPSSGFYVMLRLLERNPATVVPNSSISFMPLRPFLVQPDYLESIPGRCRTFPRCCAQPFICWVSWNLSLGKRWLDREAHHSPPISAEFRVHGALPRRPCTLSSWCFRTRTCFNLQNRHV
jgi:hypothetical protein